MRCLDYPPASPSHHFGGHVRHLTSPLAPRRPASRTGRVDIAIIASSRHPIREPFAGGLEAHTHSLAVRLREGGHRVTVYASGDSDPALGVVPVCPAPSRLDLSEAARSDPSMLADRFVHDHHAYLSLMLGLRELDYDIVHNNSLHYLPIAMADALRAPLVTTLHTPPTPWIESAVTCAGGRVPFASVSRATAVAWEHAITVDRVILNGVDLARWPFVARPRGDYAVWTGRLVPEKGPHLALEAASAAGLPLKLAGPCPDPDYFEREIAPRLDGHEYAGHLSHCELAELVGNARVALFSPCWEEPYGLVVAEALACGTPVAAFDRGAPREILDSGSGRLAPAGDVAALARAATEAIGDIDRRSCRARAESHCSHEAMVGAYVEFYEAVAA